MKIVIARLRAPFAKFVLLTATVLLFALHCGGGGAEVVSHGGSASNGVALSHYSGIIGTGLTVDLQQTFSPVVAGNPGSAVVWTATGGAFVDKTYVAPFTPGTVTLTATSTSDSTKKASATLTVRASGSLASTLLAATSPSTPLVGATVTLREPSSDGAFVIASTSTGADGSWKVYGPSAEMVDGFSLSISAPGYITQNYSNVTITSGQTTSMEQVPMAQVGPSGSAGAHGLILSALTGQSIPGLKVTLYPGINAPGTGVSSGSSTTSSSGSWGFGRSLDPGYYTAWVGGGATGYQSASFTVTASQAFDQVSGTSQDSIINPTLPAGQMRIVLTWGADPSDLDSHLTGPSASSAQRFHTWYGDKTYSVNGQKYANLDLDDVTSFGPETTTILVPTPGNYKFYVHDYSNLSSTSSNALGQSNATVKVYDSVGLRNTFHVPNTGGTLWRVCEIDMGLGGVATIAPVNQMSYSSSTGSLPIAPGSEPSDEALIAASASQGKH